MPINIEDIKQEVNILGNGIVALMIAYNLYLDARQRNQPIKVTLIGRDLVNETTAAFLVPSISFNELLSVLPSGEELIKALDLPFTDFRGGIRLSPEINQGANAFIETIKINATHTQSLARSKDLLTQFGQYSVSLWDQLYETADPELKEILIRSNYRPCREITSNLLRLNGGYRPDLYADDPNFQKKVDNAINQSNAAGYKHAKLLQPDELKKLDDSFREFCERHSVLVDGARIWKPGSGAVLRPGGCLDTSFFLSAFAKYLENVMGTFISENNTEKPCFRIERGTVIGLRLTADGTKVASFVTNDGCNTNKVATLSPPTPRSNDVGHEQLANKFFILCPGEAVGTIRRLGLKEPPSARFLGFTLQLSVPELLAKEAGLDLSGKPNLGIHTGTSSYSVIQARVVGDRHMIGIGGLKAFLGYSDPAVNAEYAMKASLHQLQMLNHIYPSILAVCLGRNVKNSELSLNDLHALISKGYVSRGVGSRAVAFDGIPTVGIATKVNEKEPINNCFICTHLSSGGVTHAPGVAQLILSELKQAGFMRTSKDAPIYAPTTSRSRYAPLFFHSPITTKFLSYMKPGREGSHAEGPTMLLGSHL